MAFQKIRSNEEGCALLNKGNCNLATPGNPFRRTVNGGKVL